MNSGGEPERDEYGLPPVDIEIPDDARDLDRDVQAYYREQRAERRRQRGRRLRGSLVKDGIVLPVLACCLILALITGTLLTVFSATSDQNLTGLPGGGGPSGHSSAPGKAPASTRPRQPAQPKQNSVPPSRTRSGAAAVTGPVIQTVSAQLPDTTLILAGGQPIQLQTLSGTMLVLLPPDCRCLPTVRWLASIGVTAHAPTYIVGIPSTIAEARAYEKRLSLALRQDVAVAYDPKGLVEDAYPPYELTALLLSATRGGNGEPGSVAYATGLSAGENGAGLIRALAS